MRFAATAENPVRAHQDFHLHTVLDLLCTSRAAFIREYNAEIYPSGVATRDWGVNERQPASRFDP